MNAVSRLDGDRIWASTGTWQAHSKARVGWRS